MSDVSVSVVTDYKGWCRSTVCNDAKCEERKRFRVLVTIDGVIFKTEADTEEIARELVRKTSIALGLVNP